MSVKFCVLSLRSLTRSLLFARSPKLYCATDVVTHIAQCRPKGPQDYYTQRLLSAQAEHPPHVDEELVKSNSTERAGGQTAISNELKRLGIKVKDLEEQQQNGLVCPKCQGGSSKELSLSVKLEENCIAWKCHRGKCGWAGRSDLVEDRKLYVRPNPKLAPLSPELLDFFKSRNISPQTLQRNKILQCDGALHPTLCFPYLRGGELINVKYRTLSKQFWQEKGAEKILYGWDDILGQEEIIIVEGEIDKLSLEEAGFRNVASVPDGAPVGVRGGRLPVPKADIKYSYIWNSLPALESAERIILATDSDPPGRALAAELARRLGPERCWLVDWAAAAAQAAPSPSEGSGDPSAAPPPPKDANDVLIADGPEALRACIRQAKMFPVAGVIRVADVTTDVLREWRTGLPPVSGLPTGWLGLDQLYRVRPGWITVISGPAGAGKTEFGLELLCRLAKLHQNFSSGLCLVEKSDVQLVVRKLLEKHVGKPLRPAAGGRPAMSAQEAASGLRWLDERFVLVEAQDQVAVTAEQVLNLARIAVTRHRVKGLLLDSFQALRASSQSGEGAFEIMRRLREFAQAHKLHVWLLAHSLPPGASALLTQLSDAGLVLERQAKSVVVSVQPVNRSCSKAGSVMFRFDEATGTYHTI